MLKHFTGPNIKSIRVIFPLSEKHESHGTRWISTAVMILNFDGAYYFVNFPFSVLTAPGQACRIKHLRLTSCNLRPLSVTNNLDSLVILELEGVNNVTDEQLDIILRTCLFLQRLGLRCCPNFRSFKLTNRNSRLRVLHIIVCLRLKSIELYSESLEILEYHGQIHHFSFKHVPKLANLFASVYEAPTETKKIQTYALSSIAEDVPRLETPSIQRTSELPLPKEDFTFTKMKYLVLKVYPCNGEDELDWISYILKAFPSLNKLQLAIPKLFVSRQSNKNARELAEVPHEYLREIEVNGFHGSQYESRFVKYLVDSAFNLDLLVISSQAKVYWEPTKWLRERRHDEDKLSRSEKIEQLQLVVPKAVRVDYRNL